MADDKGKGAASRRRAEAAESQQDQGRQDQPGVGQDQPVPAVQVGQGEHGQAAGEALGAFAHGDQPTSQRTEEDVRELTGVAADDDELRGGGQMGAAEGLQAAEAGNAQVQERANAENVAGFRGINSDPTPNWHYTSEGVAAGAPTPETDAGQFEAAQRALRAGGGRFAVTEAGQRQAERSAQARQQVDERTRQATDEIRQSAQQ